MSQRSHRVSEGATVRTAIGERRDADRGPELPAEVVDGTRARYVEAFERLTGIPFADYPADPEAVLV